LTTPAIRIEHVTAPSAAVRALIAALDAELAQNYAAEQRHGLALDALFQPHILFFLAHVSDEAIGCGGIALFPDFAELKRMYVLPDWRGRGVAEALLNRLIREAIQADRRVLRLETGIHQPAALKFYARAGFRPCLAFEPYKSMPKGAISTSVFLEREAAAGGA
jgi:putative acetyltransferase